MKIIAGLGNPTKTYEGTRHNVGFAVIDELAKEYGISLNEGKYKALSGSGYIEGEKVILVKPLTYMNLSGESIVQFVNFYKINPEEDLIVIYDDIDLDVGKLRLRGKGSAGGHNGMKNIIAHIGTQTFPRVRLGVGAKPQGWDLADYVLGHFSKEEQGVMEAGVADAAKAAAMIATQGIDMAMNKMNTKG